MAKVNAWLILFSPLTITCRIRPTTFAYPKHCSMHFLLRRWRLTCG